METDASTSVSSAVRAYVVGGGTDDTTVIDTATHEVVGRVGVGDEPMLPCLSPDGKLLLVSNRDSLDVTVVETATLEVLRTVKVQDGAAGVAFSPDGTRVFVANEYSHTVSVVDVASWEVLRHVAVGHGPCELAFMPGGREVVVTNEESHNTAVLDGVTGEKKKAIDTPDGPLGLAVAPDGSLVLVACFISNHVYGIDPSDWTVAWKTAIGTGHVGIRFVPGGRAVVANAHEDHVSIFDLSSREEVGRVRVGQNPAELEVLPGGRLLYVADRGGDTVSVVSLEDMCVVKTIPVGSSPLGICVG